MAEPMELTPLAPPRPTPGPTLQPLGTRAVGFVAIPDVKSPACTYMAITRMAAYTHNSLEELRWEDMCAASDKYELAAAQPRDLRAKTLLERDVLRAVGDVVLNQPHWWANRHDNDAWKRKKREIAMRVVKQALQDAAAHVVNWMAPLASAIYNDKHTAAHNQELTLSLLLDKWPIQFADASSSESDSTSHRMMLSEQELVECDRYVALAWAMLRTICKQDVAPWPLKWGATSCPCWSLRPLVEEVAQRGVDALERLLTHRDGGFGILPEDVGEILLAGDETATDWLMTTLFDATMWICADMATIETWAMTRLQSIIYEFELGKNTSSGLPAVAPSPFPNALLIDGVDAQATLRAADLSYKPVLVEFQTSSDGSKVTHMATVDGQTARANVGALIELLLPAFVKSLAVRDTSQRPMVSEATSNCVPTSCVEIAERPTLLVTRHPGQKSKTKGDPVQDVARPRRVLMDIQTITLAAHTSIYSQDEWSWHAPEQLIDAGEIVATAIIYIDQHNVSIPQMAVRSASIVATTSSSPATQGFCVRSAMVSSCSDTNENVFSVSAFPGRVLVLPASTQYRISKTTLVDPTQSGGVTVVRVALVCPQSRSSNESIMAQLSPASTQQSQQQREDCLFAARDQTQSVEELRFAHYSCDRQPGLTGHQLPQPWFQFAPVIPLSSPVGPPHELEQAMLHQINTLTNTPQWWTTRWIAGSVARREWEDTLERMYVLERLRGELSKGYAAMATTLGKRSKQIATPMLNDSSDGSEADGKDDDPNSDKEGNNDDDDKKSSEDPFVKIAALFSRFAMLREVHKGFCATDDRGTSANDQDTSTEAVAKIVQACCSAESVDERAQLLMAFIGANYPVESLLEPLESVWGLVIADMSAWRHRAVSLVDDRLLTRVKPPGSSGLRSEFMFAPVVDTCVWDGAVAPDVHASLLTALQSFRDSCAGTTPWLPSAKICVVHPYCLVPLLEQTPPTFGTRRAGSLTARLTDTVVPSPMDPTSSSPPSVTFIPSDVAIDLQGNVRFRSYMSNVLPRHHGGLYKSIEAIATSFIPLFEQVLTGLQSPIPGPFFYTTNARVPKPIEETKTSEELFSLRGRVVQMAVEILEMDVTTEKPSQASHAWRNCTENQQLAKRQAQVVFPCKRDATGNSVIATGFYFARVDNITVPRLTFPTSGSLSAQPRAFVDGYADRCVVIAEQQEHTIEAFELVDQSQPGTLLLVKLHLVDLNTPMVSTATVMPYQREWIVDCTLGQVSRFFHLPTEVHGVIETMLEWDGLAADSDARTTLPSVAALCGICNHTTPACGRDTTVSDE